MRRDSTLDSILRRTPGRLFLCGALLLVTHPSFFKRCGCDKEEVVVPDTSGPFLVSGTVFNFEDQMPVPGVDILFDGVEMDYSAVTDSAGQFTLVDVLKGTYDVHVSKTGFDEREKSVQIDANTTSFNIPFAMIHMTPLDIHDTFVRLGAPGTNYDEATYLEIGGNLPPADIWRTLLQVGSSAIPADAQIIRATMTGYFYDRIFDVDAVQSLWNIRTPWDPATVTWGTRPEIGSLPLGHVTHLDQLGPPFRIDWDITDVVTTYRDPHPSEPVFGVTWTWDKPYDTSLGSTGCDGPDCGGPLTGTATWYREAPDFP